MKLRFKSLLIVFVFTILLSGLSISNSSFALAEDTTSESGTRSNMISKIKTLDTTKADPVKCKVFQRETVHSLYKEKKVTLEKKITVISPANIVTGADVTGGPCECHSTFDAQDGICKIKIHYAGLDKVCADKEGVVKVATTVMCPGKGPRIVCSSEEGSVDIKLGSVCDTNKAVARVRGQGDGGDSETSGVKKLREQAERREAIASAEKEALAKTQADAKKAITQGNSQEEVYNKDIADKTKSAQEVYAKKQDLEQRAIAAGVPEYKASSTSEGEIIALEKKQVASFLNNKDNKSIKTEVVKALSSDTVSSGEKDAIVQQAAKASQSATQAATICGRLFSFGCSAAQNTANTANKKLTQMAQKATSPYGAGTSFANNWKQNIPEDTVQVATANTKMSGSTSRGISLNPISSASAAPAPSNTAPSVVAPATVTSSGLPGYGGFNMTKAEGVAYRESTGLEALPTYRQAEDASMAAYTKYSAPQPTYGAPSSVSIKASALSTELNNFAATTPGSDPFPSTNNGNTGNNGSGAGNGNNNYSGYIGNSGSSGTSSGSSSALGSLFSGIGKFLGQALGQQAQKSTSNTATTQPKPSCRLFTATSLTIKPGESTILQYAMAYSDFATISPGVGTVNPQGGTVKVSPSESTDYTYKAQNRYGYGTCPPVHVTVLADDDVSDDNFDEGTVVSCSPSRVESGVSAIVLWQCPDGTYESVGSSTEYGEFDTYGKPDGSVRVAPSETSKFVVRCRDEDNREIGRNSCTVTIGEGFSGGGGSFGGGGASGGWSDGQARAELRVNKTSVSSGDTVTIEWEGYGTSNCSITGPDNFNEQGNKGSVTGRMLQTSTFELSCKAGSTSLLPETVTIRVI